MLQNLLDFDLDGLTTWLANLGEKPFRARQVSGASIASELLAAERASGLSTKTVKDARAPLNVAYSAGMPFALAGLLNFTQR